MSLEERSRRRSRQIVAYRARSFGAAERWDLEFWQRQTPAARLSALVALHADLRAVTGRRRKPPQE